MAARHGGHLELDGGQESLVLPVARSQDRMEVEALRKERDAAQQQTDRCARELAALFRVKGSGRDVALDMTTIPPPAGDPGRTVLVVEAQDTNRYMMEALVKGCGLRVVGVTNGAKALETCVHDRPDLVLLELILPGPCDGFEVCRQLRLDPATQDVPIVVISALHDPVSRERASQAGATAYFTKPFSPIALLKEMESLIGRFGKG